MLCKVRPVKATFRGAAALSHIAEGESLTLNGEGKGGQRDLQKEVVANNAELKGACMGSGKMKPFEQEHDSEVLRVSDLHAFYDESHILHGVDFTIHRGELVTLLGRNGAGRSTTLKSLLGLVGRRTGSIVLKGSETVNMPTHKIAHLGVGYCPEERGIFASLSVEENLMLPKTISGGGMSVEEIYDMFPNLADRRRSQGTRLSGGEQQMLAMARILRTGADFLLLDEITEGLAPVIVRRLADVLAILKERDYTVILVEQNFHFAASLADRHYIMEHGHVVEMVEKHEVDSKTELIDSYLSV